MTSWETFVVVAILSFCMGFISGSDKFDKFTGYRGEDEDDSDREAR